MSLLFYHNYLALIKIPWSFPYTDTLKILEKWGPGCHFYPESDAASIDELERFLREQRLQRPSEPPILALFTEFPSNPLLRSVNLPRLRKLADEFDFVIAVDDTVGNFVNVDILPFVDVLMSSLTKIFSGAANVMGGRYASFYIFTDHRILTKCPRSCIVWF